MMVIDAMQETIDALARWLSSSFVACYLSERSTTMLCRNHKRFVHPLQERSQLTDSLKSTSSVAGDFRIFF